MLSIEGCWQRQARLREVMSQRGIDLALITHPKNVYYFSGLLPTWMASNVLAITEKETFIVCDDAAPINEKLAVNRTRTYAANAIGTIRLDQEHSIAHALGDMISSQTRVGTEYASCNYWLASCMVNKPIDLDESLFQLRRRKDADEIALLRISADCIDACYQHARQVIQPGLDELELYQQLYAVATKTAGEPIGRFGNDFQCGTPGGPPRKRPAKKGEIWILDLTVEYRGYGADTCRAFSVGNNLTDKQLAAWLEVRDVLPFVEGMIRPGVRCRSVYERAKARLDDFMPGAFFHHLGHGIGLFAHEPPHLNPHWDECFEVGDVFTIEPGVYEDSLRGGIRLENNYLVTHTGIEPLNSHSIDLLPELS